MNILPSPQQLRFLTALSESRHFGRAALACSVTQSTLSTGILTLERQLDAAILDRSAGKHVVFTPLGLELVERAGAALTALEAVAEAAHAARTPMSGPLRLGVIPTVGPFLLPRLMPVLRHGFPRLRLYLREDTTARLVERLAANRLDVLLLALPCDCGDADASPVARDEFLVALPRGHRLAAQDRSRPPRSPGNGCCCWRTVTACAIRRSPCAACWPATAKARTGSPPPACTRWCRWWPAGWG